MKTGIQRRDEDDTAFVQRCIAEGLRLPRGEFRISRTIVLPLGASLVGSG